MSGKDETIHIRVSWDEKRAWEADAARRDMPLSRWMRSACATFLVQGKATILVPAGHEIPGFIGELKARKSQPAEGRASDPGPVLRDDSDPGK